jgi:hypothetical protein
MASIHLSNIVAILRTENSDSIIARRNRLLVGSDADKVSFHCECPNGSYLRITTAAKGSTGGFRLSWRSVQKIRFADDLRLRDSLRQTPAQLINLRAPKNRAKSAF